MTKIELNDRAEYLSTLDTPEAIKELSELIMHSDITSNTLGLCLFEVMQLGNNELTDIILNNPNTDVTVHKNACLLSAAKYSEMNNIEKILNHPKFIDVPNNHSKEMKNPYIRTSYVSIQRNRMDILKLLLKKAPNNNYCFEDNILLKSCLENKEIELVNLLLENEYVKHGLFDVSIFERLNESNHEHFSG
jgi:hypothetical protein